MSDRGSKPVVVNLDPDIAEFVNFLRVRMADYPTWSEMSLSSQRNAMDAIRKPLTNGGPTMESVEDYEVKCKSDRVRIRILNATSTKQRPALIYLHGGGWVMFSLSTHDRVMRELAAGANVAVVGIDYGLAPENQFPSQLEQIECCIEWLAEYGEELGIDTSKLAIGGDSAGANLAVSTSLRMREKANGVAPVALVLFYGAYDCRCEGQSMGRFDGPEFNLGREEMRGFWGAYAKDTGDFANPLLSPILADLQGLPPAFMAIADADVLYSENIAMAQRFRDHGVKVDARTYPGTVHSFLEAVATADISKQAIQDAASWIAECLSAKT